MPSEDAPVPAAVAHPHGVGEGDLVPANALLRHLAGACADELVTVDDDANRQQLLVLHYASNLVGGAQLQSHCTDLR